MSYYILFLLGLLLWAWGNRLFMPTIGTDNCTVDGPTVSILIPLRNEENHVPDLLNNLSQLTYRNLSFYFLDDHSTDQTRALLEKHSSNLTNVHIIDGPPLPPDWVGKVHACHQLSMQTTDDYLLFLDADIRLKPDTIQRSLTFLQKEKVGLLTGFPQFPTHALLSKLLVPMQHVVVLIHLPLYIANNYTFPAFTAAHGAFMFFTKETYTKIGGHSSVKDSLVEDIHLARTVKQFGYKVYLTNITDFVTCYMYETNKEVWKGFSKNVFPGLGRSLPLVCIVTLFYLGVFILPAILAIYGLISLQFVLVIPLIITLLIRFTIDQFTKQDRFIWLLMPLSALTLLAILYYSMYLGLRKKGFEWKGRRYQ